MHVWEKNENAIMALNLLRRYGILLLKKGNHKKRSKLLREIKEFSKKCCDIGEIKD